MARKSFVHFSGFLRAVTAFWEAVGADFEADGWNLTTVKAKNAQLMALTSEIDATESRLGQLRRERDGLCSEISSFSVALRIGILARFGKESLALKLMPKLLAAMVGRPNKSAATRKANTIRRKEAAALALEAGAAALAAARQ